MSPYLLIQPTVSDANFDHLKQLKCDVARDQLYILNKQFYTYFNPISLCNDLTPYANNIQFSNF